MNKQDLISYSKTKDFIRAIKEIGYTEVPNKKGSHRIFKKGNKTLSIPDGNHAEISIGVRQNLCRIIFSKGK